MTWNIFKRWRENNLIKTKAEATEMLKAEAKKIEMFTEAIKSITRPEPLKTSTVNSTVTGSFDSSTPESKEPVYFYDFLKEWNNSGTILLGAADVPMMAVNRAMEQDAQAVGGVIAMSESIETKAPKVIIKPIDVVAELERLPDAISMTNLEEKIVTFKMREKFIRNNQYSKKECIDMLTRLENRRKYEKFKEFFEQFDYTTTEKVSKLTTKYELVLKSTDLFIPTFPAEAIEIMHKYEEKTIELCNKKPVFYVIAENEKFKKEYDRNDPILLVQSPFGVYWQILGAWDKEILLLEEL